MKLPKPRKLQSGSWFLRVMINGETTPITKPTEAECIAEYMALKAGVKKAATSESRGTLEAACKKYISDRENVLSASTILGYKRIMKNRFQDQMPKQLRSITQSQWQQAVNREAKVCSPKYLKNSWGFISSVIKDATGMTYTIRLPQVVAHDLPFVPYEDMAAFLAAIRDDSCEVQILLGLHSLRLSEILAVSWENIDLKKHTISVRGAAVWSDKGLVYQEANKNTTSRRTVPILIPRLTELLEAVSPENRTGLLYTQHPNNIYKHLHDICEANDLQQISVHSLRRTFASMALHAGVSEAACQKLGGWADAQTMKKVYQKISDKDVKDQAEKMGTLFANL